MNKLKKNESGFSAVEVILVLVIVVLLGVVGWFVYKNQKKTTPTTTTTSTKPSTTNSEQINPSVKPYPGWKTYSSSVLSATFKYPADWVEWNSPTNGVSLKSADFSAGQGLANISAGSYITINQNPSTGETLDQAAAGSNSPVSNKQNITVDGVKAIRYTKATTGENQDSSTNVIIIKGSTTYYITQLYKLNADNPYPKIFDGVIDTFKFK